MDYGYDEATTLTMLGEKAAALETSVNKLRGRALELEHRPLVIERVAKTLEGVNQTVEFVKVNRTWVTKEQIGAVLNKTAAFEAWWRNVSALQEERKLTEDPAYSVNDVAKRLQAVQKEAEKLMRIQYIPNPPPTPGGKSAYDDPFGGNYSKEWFEALKKNLSANGTNGTPNFSGFNFSDLNFTAEDAAGDAGSESASEEQAEEPASEETSEEKGEAEL